MDEKPQEPKKRLKPKQIKLINGIAEGKTIQQSALEAGYGHTIKSAAVMGSVELKKLNQTGQLDEALDKMGATIEASARVIADAHQASNDGKPDHHIRLKASEMNLRARRLISSSEGHTTQVNLFSSEFMEKLINVYEQRTPPNVP